MPTCFSCLKDKRKDDFSKNQLKRKGNQAKCRACVAIQPEGTQLMDLKDWINLFLKDKSIGKSIWEKPSWNGVLPQWVVEILKKEIVHSLSVEHDWMPSEECNHIIGIILDFLCVQDRSTESRNFSKSSAVVEIPENWSDQIGEIQIFNYQKENTAHALRGAIEKQSKRFNCSWQKFLQLRQDIIMFIKNSLHLRQEMNLEHTSKIGWKEYVSKRGQEVGDYDLFGLANIYLQGGPDESIMLAAKEFASHDQRYGKLSDGSLSEDAEKAANHPINILEAHTFGYVYRVMHNNEELRVKAFDVSTMYIAQSDQLLNNGSNDFINSQLLNQDDLKSSRAQYRSPYVARFVKSSKSIDDKKFETCYHASEMGATFREEEIDQEYGAAMKKWLADTKDARKIDPVCNLTNISEYEKMRRKQLVEILLGICFMHWRGFTHNDINLRSIMCGKKDGKCKITGMGQSLRYSMHERENKMCDHDRAGQPKFRSPEANYVREHWDKPVSEQAVHLEHTRFFMAEANDIWCFTVVMFILMFNMAPYTEQSVVDSDFHYVTEGRFLKAEQWQIIQKRVNEASKMKPKRRKHIITDCDENGIADLKKGIAKVVQKNARVRRRYVVPITAECVDVMHRGFMPEALRPSAAELLLDPYFEAALKEKIQEMQEWQRENCGGNCDDIYKNLLDQAKEDRARKSSRTNYEYSEKDKWSKSYFPSKDELQAAVDLWYSSKVEATEKYGHITTWNTSFVTDMSELFKDQDGFNEEIGKWDVSSVTNMSGMFHGARDFNADISQWDTSSVKDMNCMFYNAKTFNRNIGNWDTSCVTNMQYMFYYATAFNADIGAWDTLSVTNMSYMLNGCISFNADIGNWDTSSVTDMKYMFYGAVSFNADISNWDTSSVSDMKYMFSGAASFDADILSKWKLNGVTLGMFNHAKAFTAKFGKLGPPIDKEIHQALVRLGKPTDRESVSKYYYVKPGNTLYVLPDEVRRAAFEYIEQGGDGYRLALLNTKKVIDAMKMNLDRDWEEFRLTVLREIISRKENCTIDNFETGHEYKCFQAQLQMNLACCERYLVRAVVPQWDDYASAESAMFPNVFGSSSLPWDTDRNIPYRLHPFLQSVKRPIPGAPAWYIKEKDEYVGYMEKVEEHIRILLRDKLENSRI